MRWWLLVLGLAACNFAPVTQAPGDGVGLAGDCEPGCSPGETCEHGKCLCQPSECAGCCASERCLVGTEPDGCGVGGVTCTSCDATTKGPICVTGACGCSDNAHCATSLNGPVCKSDGACGCRVSADCPVNQACTSDGVCRPDGCDADHLCRDGCCSINGSSTGTCLGTNQCPNELSCGEDGLCPKMCGLGVNCRSGCCADGTCASGTVDTQCGNEGRQCAACAGGKACTDGACTCDDNTQCAAGQACTDNRCGVACSTGSPCKEGCCDNGTCVLASASTPQKCKSDQTAPFCLAITLTCGCATSDECSATHLVCAPSTSKCTPCVAASGTPQCPSGQFCDVSGAAGVCKPASDCAGCIDSVSGACNAVVLTGPVKTYRQANGTCGTCDGVVQGSSCVPCSASAACGGGLYCKAGKCDACDESNECHSNATTCIGTQSNTCRTSGDGACVICSNPAQPSCTSGATPVCIGCTAGSCSAAICDGDTLRSGGSCNSGTGACDYSTSVNCAQDTCSGTTRRVSGSCSTAGGTAHCVYATEEDCALGYCVGNTSYKNPGIGCTNGVCQGGSTVTNCNATACDVAATGRLLGRVCTGTGSCTGGVSDTCPADGPSVNAVCTDAHCSAGVCGQQNNSVACNDGVITTKNDTCAAGVCSGTSYTCPQCQTQDGSSCVAASGSCDDGISTTIRDTCSGGACVGEDNYCTPPDNGLCQASTICATPTNHCASGYKMAPVCSNCGSCGCSSGIRINSSCTCVPI